MKNVTLGVQLVRMEFVLQSFEGNTNTQMLMQFLQVRSFPKALTPTSPGNISTGQSRRREGKSTENVCRRVMDFPLDPLWNQQQLHAGNHLNLKLFLAVLELNPQDSIGPFLPRLRITFFRRAENTGKKTHQLDSWLGQVRLGYLFWLLFAVHFPHLHL